eukprot:TRINITY_DN38223_c0_g2_i1.p1 TRINITY_DN38223_c0_g2~~TRINITY_DN38223_c0_g2_i1.p1  ORF type:complete len:435 (+),score=60.48 TRINITY_DN38223_c0_g2_i1:28-1305(+)
MPVIQPNTVRPCVWLCWFCRLLRYRHGRANDETQVALRSRMQEVFPELPYLYILIPPRNIEEFFRVEGRLGEGGFGTVSRVKPTQLGLQYVPDLVEGKSYALKRVHRPKRGLAEEVGYSLLGVSAQRHLEFLRSIQTSALAGTGLLGFTAGFVEAHSAVYQVMEVLEGEDLFEFLTACCNNHRKPEEREAAGLILQIFKALHYFHRTIGALHRDVKPENFGFVSRPVEGQPLPILKLFDIGLAWVLPEPVTEESASTLVNMRVCVGTKQYMAPEVFDSQCGPPSDVWGAGVVSYLLLSMRMPYKILQSRHPKQAIRENSLDFDGDGWADVSEPAKQFIAGVLEKDHLLRTTTHAILESSWLIGVPGGDAPTPLSRAGSSPVSVGAFSRVDSSPSAMPLRTKRKETGFFETMMFAEGSERFFSAAG